MLQRPYSKVCLGAEVKQSIEGIMVSLPEPETIQTNLEVMTVFYTLFYQGKDQAKVVIKGNMTFLTTMPYLLFSSPYWASVWYGPFISAQMTIHTYKLSNSANFVETTKAAYHLAMAPVQWHLFLLGTPESAEELE
jgi:hypothetical protein